MKKLPPRTTYLILEFCAALFFGLVFNVNMVYQATVAHLTPLQLVLIGTILESSVFLFEIPTGVLADVKSRRLSIIIGYFLIGAGFLVEGSAPVFWAIALAQVLWGIGYTFTSGATQAWIADEIGDKDGQGEDVGQVFLRGAQMNRIGGLIAIPISVGLGSLILTLPILLGGALMILLAIFLIFAMSEHGFTPTPSAERTTWAMMRKTVGDARGLIRRQPLLLSVLVIGVFYGLYSEAFDRLWTPHFLQNCAPDLSQIKPVVWLGAMNTLGMLLSLVVTEIVRRRVDVRQSRALARFLMLNAGVMVLALAGFGLAPTFWPALVAFWVFGVARSVAGPLQTTWVNGYIDDPQVRATMLSVSSQTDAIGQIVGGPFLGAIGNRSIRAALVVAAVILSPVIPLYAATRRRAKI
ncbi:MAG TPA: MFS transporter [Anaerolineae bacterium]|nr:MFS transporter [Anaerolineae bacterium]